MRVFNLIFLFFGFCAIPLASQDSDTPQAHPLYVHNGSDVDRQGSYLGGITVHIQANPPNPATDVFLRWYAGGSIIFGDIYSESTTLTMPYNKTTVTAIYGNIKTWFPPGQEGVSEGLLTPRIRNARQQKRAEMKIRVELVTGNSEGVRVDDIWRKILVASSWYPAEEGTWHENKMAKVYSAKIGGSEINRSSSLKPDKFVKNGNKYEASVWFESVWPEAPEGLEANRHFIEKIPPSLNIATDLVLVKSQDTNPWNKTVSTVPGTIGWVKFEIAKDSWKINISQADIKFLPSPVPHTAYVGMSLDAEDVFEAQASVKIHVAGPSGENSNNAAKEWSLIFFQNVIRLGNINNTYEFNNVVTTSGYPIPGFDTGGEESEGDAIPNIRNFTINDEQIPLAIRDSPGNNAVLRLNGNILIRLISSKFDAEFISWLGAMHDRSGAIVCLKWVRWHANYDVTYELENSPPDTRNGFFGASKISEGDGKGEVEPVFEQFHPYEY